MSARLSMNAIRYTNWKGKTFQQVSSSILKNNPENAGTIDQIMRPLPLKIYRREIAIQYPEKSCSVSRFSVSMDELLRPNGAITRPYSTPEDTTGIINTLDFNYNENKSENYICSSSSAKCAENDARRRVRSSGMIRKKYDPLRQDTAYFTNSTQYLTSRAKTFHQNQYQHVRRNEISLVSQGHDTITSFVPNGLSHCPKVEISTSRNNNVLSYLWIDYESTFPNSMATYLHQIIIPDGVYDVADLNGVVEKALIANSHYYINNENRSKVALIKFIYNVIEKKVELQLYSTAIVDNANYSVPIGFTWEHPSTNKLPVVFIHGNNLQNVIGFESGYYPDMIEDSTANERDTNYGIVSNRAGSLTSSLKSLVYKPSNMKFASQGGVSASERTLREKYNSITNSGKLFKAAYGQNLSSALAYGVGGSMYSIKDRVGYRMTKTPVFDKNTGVKRCVEYTTRKYCEPTVPVVASPLSAGVLNTIAEYLRLHMEEFRNLNFWAYTCDGDNIDEGDIGTHIGDGGNDMYDGGNFVTPWLLSGERYDLTNSSVGGYPYCVSYSNTTEQVVDTDFNYISLGWIFEEDTDEPQIDQSRHPITLLGYRNDGPVGWQVGGNVGADGGGLATSGYVYNGETVNGFTVYAGYRQVYGQNDPTICNLVILLGHSFWGTVFGPITLISDDSDSRYCQFVMYSGEGSKNVFSIHTLLSKPNTDNTQPIPNSELETVIENFTNRIRQVLNL